MFYITGHRSLTTALCTGTSLVEWAEYFHHLREWSLHCFWWHRMFAENGRSPTGIQSVLDWARATILEHRWRPTKVHAVHGTSPISMERRRSPTRVRAGAVKWRPARRTRIHWASGWHWWRWGCFNGRSGARPVLLQSGLFFGRGPRVLRPLVIVPKCHTKHRHAFLILKAPPILPDQASFRVESRSIIKHIAFQEFSRVILAHREPTFHVFLHIFVEIKKSVRFQMILLSSIRRREEWLHNQWCELIGEEEVK